MDNALKAIGRTDEALRVGNYIVLYGGRDLEGIATPRKNADGSLGEYFAATTDLSSRFTKAGRLPVDWEHGRDPDQGDPGVLGYVDWSTAKADDTGVWVERVLDRRNAYMRYLESLIDAGLVGNSSEADPSAVVKADDGMIVRWPLVADTLTVTPMDPRMLTENALQAAKALGLVAEQHEPEDKAEAAASGAASGKAAPVSDESHPTEEVATMEEESVVTLSPEALKALVTEAVDDGVKAYIASQPRDDGGFAVTESPGRVTHDEADNPFESLADQCKAVKDFELHVKTDPRLTRIKATGAAEGQPSEGGYLLEPNLTTQFLVPLHETGPFSQMIAPLPVTNGNYGWINGVDETSRATGSRWGGIRGYRLAEGGTLTASKPKFRRINWELKKYAVLVYGTDELLADAAQFSVVVNRGASEELSFMVNDDIFRGAGLAGPEGVLTSGALISVAKETGQKADTIVIENLMKMWQRMDPYARANAAWYINSEVEPELDKLAMAVGTAALEPRYVSYGQDSVMRIKGRPVVVNEFSSALGDVGDILLGNFRDHFLYWEKGGVQSAQSIHVQFLTDESVFRFIFRCDGKTDMASAITPYKGSNTQSAFVTLAERA